MAGHRWSILFTTLWGKIKFLHSNTTFKLVVISEIKIINFGGRKSEKENYCIGVNHVIYVCDDIDCMWEQTDT
jgi:hypothetical protein